MGDQEKKRDPQQGGGQQGGGQKDREGGEFPRTLLDQSTSCSRDMKLRMRSDLISAGGVTGFRGNHGLVSGIRQRYTVTR